MPMRISGFLSKALYITLLIFLLIAFALSINSLFNPDPHFRQLEMGFKWVALILLIVFLACIFIIIKNTEEDNESEKLKIKDLVFIFLIALSLRLTVVLFYGYFTAPYADSLDAHIAGIGYGLSQFFPLYKPWAIYSMILYILYEITIPHFIAAQLLNTIVTSLTAVLVYFLALKISEKRSVALTAGIIFTFYPANILLNTFLTPEHLAMPLILIAFILLLSPRRGRAPARPATRQYTKNQYIVFAVTGIICALAENLKPIVPIVIIAYVITMVLEYMQRNSDLPEYPGKSKTLLINFLSLIILIAAFLILDYAILRIAESLLNIEFALPRHFRAHTFWVGLQPTGEGQVFLGYNPRYYLYLLNITGWDFELARTKTYEYLAQQIYWHPEQFAMLFPRKFRWAWQDDTSASYFIWMMASQTWYSPFHSTEIISHRLLRIAGEVLPTISQIFYMSLLAFSGIGLLGAIRNRFNAGLFLISLYCFGFFLLLLIMEAQSRYKVIIIPCLCILAAHGMHMAADWCNKKRLTGRLNEHA